MMLVSWLGYPTDLFNRDTIASTLEYYLKVFGNVRAKDLCYRYNSNILKGATVGVRQRLAGGGGKGSKKGKKKKQNDKNTDGNTTGKMTRIRIRVDRKLLQKPHNFERCLPKDVRVLLGFNTEEEEEKAGEEHKDEEEQKMEEEQNEKENEDADACMADTSGYDSSDDEEPEVYQEYDVDFAKQHSTMIELAEQDLEVNEDYTKESNLDKDTDEHMGNVTTEESLQS